MGKPCPREFRDDIVRVAPGRDPGVTASKRMPASRTVNGRHFVPSRKHSQEYFSPGSPAHRRNRKWDTRQVIVEHALLPVISGREDDFERAFAEARVIITSIPGCRRLSLSRSIEAPSNYLLLVEWEHLEDHTIGFRQSEQYQKWRTLLHHFDDPFPLVEHYQAVQ